MSNYKRLLGKTETRYVIEFATGGSTSAASVGSGSVVKSAGGVQRRGGLLTPVEEKETISVPVTQKPRQGPLRPQTGAGQHRDKKKEQKQGKEKHKKPFAEQGVAEGIDGSNDFYAFADLFSHPDEYTHPDPEEAVRLITDQGQNLKITASNIIKFAKSNPDELGNSAVANAVKSLMSQGVAEGSDWGEPQEVLADVMSTLERQVEWPLTDVMDPREVQSVLQPVRNAINKKLQSLEQGMAENQMTRDTELANVHPGATSNDNEYDMEGDFVKNQIHTIMRVSKHLDHALGDDENLPEWVQMKISQAQAMMVGVMDYVISEKEKAKEKETGGDEMMAEEKIKGVDGKACWKGKRYAGKVKKADGTYKDKCVPVGEDVYTAHLLNQLETVISEKAVSKAQQKFMGMVHAVQKGEMKAPSKDVAKAAKGMSMKAGHDFAATKHKGLPDKKSKK